MRHTCSHVANFLFILQPRSLHIDILGTEIHMSVAVEDVWKYVGYYLITIAQNYWVVDVSNYKKINEYILSRCYKGSRVNEETYYTIGITAMP